MTSTDFFNNDLENKLYPYSNPSKNNFVIKQGEVKLNFTSFKGTKTEGLMQLQ